MIRAMPLLIWLAGERLFTALLAALILALGSGLYAANITVNSTTDNAENDDSCTLREAINNANLNTDTTGGDCVAGFGDDRINFSVSGTIILSNVLPDISGKVTIDGSGQSITIGGNDAWRPFLVIDTATLDLRNLAVVNGVADFHCQGDAIKNDGTLHVTNTTISFNGGFLGFFFKCNAIYNTGVASLTNSTFSNNDGGGIYNSGTVKVTNSTFSDNYSGAIFNDGTLGVTNCTFSGNNGGAIQNVKSVTVTNSIIAGTTFNANCSSSITDGGNNLDSDGTCGFSSGTTDPLLDAAGLQNNDGPTNTISLQSDSPAIDAGNDAVCRSAPVNGVDQRGVARPQGGACDIGAFELALEPFFDTFDDNDASDWMPSIPIWTVQSQALCGSTDAKALIISPYSGCSQCTVEVDIMIEQSLATASLLAWFVDKKNYVEISLNVKKDQVQLKQKASGKTVAKGKVTGIGLQFNTVHHASVNFDGAAFHVSIDGTNVINVSSPVRPHGTIAARLKKGSACFPEFQASW